jgi:alpha-L-fucosidase 2
MSKRLAILLVTCATTVASGTVPRPAASRVDAPGPARQSRAASTAVPPPAALRLWYRAPAASWNEALPIGNGRLGAMVFGGTREERLQLNEDTIWAGEKRHRINPAAAAALPEVRRLLFEGKARRQSPHFRSAPPPAVSAAR